MKNRHRLIHAKQNPDRSICTISFPPQKRGARDCADACFLGRARGHSSSSSSICLSFSATIVAYSEMPLPSGGISNVKVTV